MIRFETRLVGLLLVVALGFIVVGCDGNGDSGNGDAGNNAPADISGTWSGTGSDGIDTYELIFNLVQNGTAVTGDYEAEENIEVWTNVLSGTYENGVAYLELIHRNVVDLTTTLTFTGDTTTGTLTSPLKNTSGSIALTKEN